MLQSLRCSNPLCRVDGKHLRDQVLGLRRDVQPVLVVEAVHALLDLGEQACLSNVKPMASHHSFVATRASEGQELFTGHGTILY